MRWLIYIAFQQPSLPLASKNSHHLLDMAAIITKRVWVESCCFFVFFVVVFFCLFFFASAHFLQMSACLDLLHWQYWTHHILLFPLISPREHITHPDIQRVTYMSFYFLACHRHNAFSKIMLIYAELSQKLSGQATGAQTSSFHWCIPTKCHRHFHQLWRYGMSKRTNNAPMTPLWSITLIYLSTIFN